MCSCILHCRTHRKPIMWLYKLFGVRYGHPTRLRFPDRLPSLSALCQQIRCQMEERWFVFRLTLCSLFYNSLTSPFTVVDTLLEPMFWFVDHFVRYLGPVSFAFSIKKNSMIVSIVRSPVFDQIIWF